jgi:Aspartyl protease/Domain of unknown function (DUF4124)
MRLVLLAALILLPAVALLSPDAGAQTYRWVDDDGNLHFTTGLTSVPERYRKSAELFAVPRQDPESPVMPPPPQTLPPDDVTRINYSAGRQILVSARLNGRGPVTLLLDTGADATVVSYRALARLGIDWSAGSTGIIHGVTGSAYATAVSIESVEVGNARVGPIPVIAHNANFAGSDGLLGRDFLNHFHVTIDSASGVVTLTRR